MKNFQWDLVVYDEVEEFPEMINHPNYTKPFTERKYKLNYWRPTPVVQKQAIQDVYLKRSVLCNEKRQYGFGDTVKNYMNRRKNGTYAKSLEETDGIRSDCEDPITKM